MDCKQCPLTNNFWNSVIGDDSKEKTVLRMYYRRHLDIECFDKELKLCAISSVEVAKIIISIMQKHSCKEILNILSHEWEPYPIDKKDICQYSDFDDCYYNVVNMSIKSDIEGITWDKLGFLLQQKPASKIARMKYGENHGKVAIAMGLMSFDNKHDFWVTTFGRVFNDLSEENKENLKPKLCLMIPIIQNFFMFGQKQEIMDSYFSILSESTQKRRRPNIKRLISIVNSAL